MTHPKDSNGDDLLVLATWMYYKDQMTHQEIADELSLSRVAVTRLLQRARREGIVEFRITRPRPRQHELARQLMTTFGLENATVVASGATREETLEALGRAAAHHLEEVVFPHCRIGVGWSQTVSRMASYLTPPLEPIPVTVNELAGSMLGHHNPYSVSSDLVTTFDGVLESLPVPALVQSSTTRDVLLQEETIASALQNAVQCDVAFVGLGDVGAHCTMLQTGFMTHEQMETVREQGAIGEILLRYYSLEGEHVPTALDDRIITLEWDALRRLPYIVGMATGEEKVCTILGALRGRLIQALIADAETVQMVLDKAEETNCRAPRQNA